MMSLSDDKQADIIEALNTTSRLKGLTSWLMYVMFYCVLSLSNVVFWVRCCTLLY